MNAARPRDAGQTIENGAPVSMSLCSARKHANVLRVVIVLLFLLCASIAHSAEFRTDDELKALVYGEYPLGVDYF